MLLIEWAYRPVVWATAQIVPWGWGQAPGVMGASVGRGCQALLVSPAFRLCLPGTDLQPNQS